LSVTTINRFMADLSRNGGHTWYARPAL
jgi:hypothetical protein